MTAQQSSSNGQSQPYLSKKVIINGQFVTLYSVNGLTWLSSPEDLPDTMARLDNTRVTLADPKAEKEEKDEKSEKGDKKAKDSKEAPQLPKLASSQYRMKGPKPRPILRQGGKVVEGPPIEPPSAAAVNMKAGIEALPQIKITPAEKAPRRAKLVAPIAQKRPGQVKQPKAAPPAKVVPGKGAGKTPLAAKGKAAPPAKPLNAKGAKKQVAPVPVKGKKVVGAPVKAPKAAAPAKSVAKSQKAAKKPVAKPIKAKKSAPKAATKKRSKR
jgi:hypothetical protein